MMAQSSGRAAWRVWGVGLVLVSAYGMAARGDGPIPGWGEPIVPDGDCEIVADAEGVTIKVAAAAHELKAEAGKQNAPRVLREIEGNHEATVEVSGVFKEGTGAGLLLWLDERNFIRFARAGGEAPVLEYWRDGRLEAVEKGSEAVKLAGPKTWLRLTRRMDKLKAEASTDGEQWKEFQTLTIRLSSRMRLGVVATNTSGEPFPARFEGFTVKGIPLYPVED